MTTTSDFEVTGMTCGCCVNSVSKQIWTVAGVESVEVDLEAGRVSVVGDGYTDAQVLDAVSQAGYSATATSAATSSAAS